MKRISRNATVSWLALGALIGSLAGACQTDEEAKKAPSQTGEPRFSAQKTAFSVRLLHLSDMESALLPTGSAAAGHGGIARAASLATALRAQRDMPTLTLAAGDSWMPAPIADIDIKTDAGEKRNVVMQANALLGIDASALGNHEFDFGEGHLASLIAQAAYPYLSASLTITGGPLLPLVVTDEERAAQGTWLSSWPGRILPHGLVCTGATLLPAGKEGPDALARCPGQVVGVVGTTTQTLRTLSSISDHIGVPDDQAGLLAATQREVNMLHDAGVTVIVLLSHLQDLKLDLALVEQGLSHVDVIVSGGSDTRLADPADRLLTGHGPAGGCKTRTDSCFPLIERSTVGEPMLVVSTDGSMTYLGQLVMAFDKLGVLTGFETRNSRPIPIDDTSLSELSAAPIPAAQRLEADINAAIAGKVTPFAETTYFLDGRRESVRNHETNLADLSADAMVWSARRAQPEAEVAFALRNGGGIRAPIGAVDEKSSALIGGVLTPFATASAFRFNNDIVVVEVTHAQIRSALESTLRLAGTERGHFPQVSAGVRLVYDPAGADQVHQSENGHIVGLGCPGTRVIQLSYTDAAGEVQRVVDNGVVLNPKRTLRIATLAYLASGGDGYFPAAVVPVVPAPPGTTLPTEQSAFTDFITEHVAKGTWARGAGYPDIAQVPAADRRIYAAPRSAGTPLPARPPLCAAPSTPVAP